MYYFILRNNGRIITVKANSFEEACYKARVSLINTTYTVF